LSKRLPNRVPAAGVRDGTPSHGPLAATASHATQKPELEPSALPLSREGSGRRRCGRDGWFAAGAAVAQALADHPIPAGQLAHDALALVADGRSRHCSDPGVEFGCPRGRRFRWTTSRSPSAQPMRSRSWRRSGAATAANAQRQFSRQTSGLPHSRRASHPRQDCSASTVPSADAMLHRDRPAGSNYLSHCKLRGPTTFQMGNYRERQQWWCCRSGYFPI
jgi:hypothetical protein